MLLALAAVPEAHAQGGQSSGFYWEIKVHNDSHLGAFCLAILNDEGDPLCDDSPSPGCNVPDPDGYPTTQSYWSVISTFGISTDPVDPPGTDPVNLTIDDAWSANQFITLHLYKGGSCGPPAVTEEAETIAIYAFSQLGLVPGGNTFVKPFPTATSSPDTEIYVTAAGGGGLVAKSAPVGASYRYEDYLDDRFVWPYDYGTFCAQGGPSCPVVPLPGASVGSGFGAFLARVREVPTAQRHAFTFSTEGDPRVFADWETDWDIDGLEVAFGPTSALEVDGVLNTEGEENDPVTFTEADQGQGWRGIEFRGASGGGAVSLPASVLDYAAIEHVGVPEGETNRAVLGAVFVTNRSVELHATEVHDSVNGVLGLVASGTAAHVLVTETSQIHDNEGGGVLAASGATVTINDESEVRLNPGGGVAANGYGSTLILDGATVEGNGGQGVWARNDGQILFENADPLGFVQVLGNDGGLDANTGGSLDAGQCPGGTLPCPGRNQHVISGNSQNGAFLDARSVSGSTLYAEGNDWDVTDVSQLELDCDGASVLRVCPLVGGTCVEPQCGGSEGRTGAGLGGVLRGMEDVLALVDEAERARLAGDMEAFDIAADAVIAALASEGEDERRAAFEGATRLFAWAQPAGPLASLSILAGQPGEGRPWALRALGVARASGEDYALARAAADTLASAS